jgi:hypothetical protein
MARVEKSRTRVSVSGDRGKQARKREATRTWWYRGKATVSTAGTSNTGEAAESLERLKQQGTPVVIRPRLRGGRDSGPTERC